jgi:hypothetical protein
VWTQTTSDNVTSAALSPDGASLYYTVLATVTKIRTSDKFQHWSVATTGMLNPGPTDSIGRTMVIDSSENIYVSGGGYFRKYNSSGGVVWTSTGFPTNVISLSPDGASLYYTKGQTDVYAVALLRKLTSTGANGTINGQTESGAISSGSAYSYGMAVSDTHAIVDTNNSGNKIVNLATGVVSAQVGIVGRIYTIEYNATYQKFLCALASATEGITLLDSVGTKLQGVKTPPAGTSSTYGAAMDKTTLDIYYTSTQSASPFYPVGKMSVGQTIN